MEEATALLVVAFGGPEHPEGALSFVRSVVAGRGVPDARIREVAARYEALGGSPLPAQARALAEALAAAASQRLGRTLLPAVGFLHGSPSVHAALQRLANEGHRRLFVLPMSAYGGAAACLKYRRAVEAARTRLDPSPHVVFAPPFFALPGFLRAHARALLDVLAKVSDPEASLVIFSAHSVPIRMPGAARYQAQVEAATAEVARLAGIPSARHRLAWQSRSGRPQDPWLGPSVEEALRTSAERGVRHVAICPVGFVSDHMEVRWDLDREALPYGEGLGLRVCRSETPGTDAAFVANLLRLLLAAERGASLPLGPLARGPWGADPCDWCASDASSPCCTDTASLPPVREGSDAPRPGC